MEVQALETHIREDAKHNVGTCCVELELLFFSGVTSLAFLASTNVLFQFHFLRGLLDVGVHVLKNLGGNFVVLLDLEDSELLGVLVAPFKLALIVHRHRLALYVLHRFKNILSHLATVNCLV